MQVEVATLDVGGNVVLTLTARGIEEDRLVYVLDLYARNQEPSPTTWDHIFRWQNAAREAIKSAFELAITEEARCLFWREE